MGLSVSRILVLATCLLVAALPILGQTHGNARRPKVLGVVKCSHSPFNDFMLCGPFVQSNSDDAVPQYIVTVQVTIDELGNVVSARAVSGNADLREYALADVKRQKFTEKLLSDKLTKVTGVLIYEFENK